MRLAQYFSAHIIFVFPSPQVDNQDSNKNNQQSLCSSLTFPSPFFCTIKYPENYTIKSSGHYYFYDQVLWTFLRLNQFPASVHMIQPRANKLFASMLVLTCIIYSSLRLYVYICAFFSYVLHLYTFILRWSCNTWMENLIPP